MPLIWLTCTALETSSSYFSFRRRNRSRQPRFNLGSDILRRPTRCRSVTSACRFLLSSTRSGSPPPPPAPDPLAPPVNRALHTSYVISLSSASERRVWLYTLM